MSIYWWFVVILVTVLMSFGWGIWVGAWASRPPRVPVERLADPAPLPGELPRAGRLEVSPGWVHVGNSDHVTLIPFAGAADPAQQMAPVPWDLAGAAYALGQHRADQDEITRQVDAIMLEVELDPRWRYR